MPPASNEQETTPEELQRKQQWEEIISELHAEPISIPLEAYFTELKHRLPSWDEDDFIEGVKRFANLWSEREKYFKNKLNGLHNPNSFTKAWNESHPQQRITALDQGIRLQCPPTWSRELRDGHWVLIYQAEARLSQGLNELFLWPTTLDCGMCCQLAMWMAMRYFNGDNLFDNLFDFKPGQFILTQRWNIPMNEAGSMGNLLYHFYDDPRRTNASSESKPRLVTKTVFNHPLYIYKHPGGMGRLQNVIQIKDDNLVFDPESPQNMLSNAQLEQKLRLTFDAHQDSADFEKLEFYRECPDEVPWYRNFPHRTAEVIAEDAKKFAMSTLSDEVWEQSSSIRRFLESGLHLVFNFPRLIRCLQEAEDAYRHGDTDYDALRGAKWAQQEDQSKARQAMILGMSDKMSLGSDC